MYDIGKLTEISRLCSAIKTAMSDNTLAVTISNDESGDYILMYGAEEFKATFPNYRVNLCDGYNILVGEIGDMEVHCVERK